MNGRLKRYREISTGAIVEPSRAKQPHTGSWRMGLKPKVELSHCVDCLLCWVNCPDTAVLTDEGSFFGFDYRYCKGCELCEEVCPTNAIEMVEEDAPVPDYGRGGEE